MEFRQLRDPHFDTKCVGFYVYDLMNTPCLFVCFLLLLGFFYGRLESSIILYIILNVKCLKDNVD